MFSVDTSGCFHKQIMVLKIFKFNSRGDIKQNVTVLLRVIQNLLARDASINEVLTDNCVEPLRAQ